MAERVLCDCELRVSLDGGGEMTRLTVTDGETLRFWATTDDLEGALFGETVQLSAPNGYCQIVPIHGRLDLEFGLEGAKRQQCRLSLSEFAEALAWVRNQGEDPEAPEPSGSAA